MNNDSLPARKRQAHESAAPLCRTSDRLTEAIDLAAAPERRAADGRGVRSDGWTPERIRIFLHALADCGVITDAVEAAGMSRGSAYAFRRRPDGRAFAIGWDGAEMLGRRRLGDELISRALHGCVERIVRDGKIVAERHRYCATTSLSVLRRLDQKMIARDSDNVSARLAAQEFDEFVEIVCAGGEGAAEFLISRSEAEGLPTPRREAGLLDRLAAYRRRLLGKR